MFATPVVRGQFKVKSVPAPVGGLNARDPFTAMEPTDAIVLRNFWPQPYGVAVRNGTKQWATQLSGTVHSFATLNTQAGAQYFYAWADTSFYDISASGVAAAPLITGLTNAAWSAVQFGNDAGNHTIAVNGEDDAILLQGAAPLRIIAGDGIAPNTWAGLDPANAAQITAHQGRLWVVEKDSAVGWYLPVGAIQGTLDPFDFGPQFRHGGYLVWLATWTMDDGNGAEDHLVALSSRGDIVVYGGTDPDDPTKWQLVGVYYVGPTVAGRRTFVKAAGDLIILVTQGAVSMTELLVSTRVDQQLQKLKTDKIQYLISELTSSNGQFYGWEIQYFAAINQLLINVPTIPEQGNIQLAANQLINAWTQFNGQDAAAWWQYGDRLFFGDFAGTVWEAWTGTVDHVELDGSNGSGILAAAVPAFSYLDAPAVQSQLGMYRFNFITGSLVNYKSAALYDFEASTLAAPDASAPANVAVWDQALWDESSWFGANYVQREWVQAAGIGNAVTLELVTRSTTDVLWVATDYSYLNGEGIL